jgi:hypothetical protein
LNAPPCNDCPWRRNAAPGWLGTLDAAEWAAIAHSDDTAECHTRLNDEHCAGLAIYRANVCKMARGDNPKAEPDREAVFSSPMEFHEYHTGEPLPADWVTRRFR